MDIELDSYIKLDNRQDIRLLISNVQKSEFLLQIWQKQGRNQRVLSMGKIKKVYENGEMLIVCMDIKEAKKLNPDLPIYFFSPLRKLVFKTKFSPKSNGQFLMTAPEEVRIEETRREPRKKHGLRSYQTAHFHLLDRNLFVKGAHIIDSSEGGMGALVSTKYIGCIEEGERIKIEDSTIDGHNGLFGIIRNICKFDNPLTGEKLIRLGIELFEFIEQPNL